MSSRRIRAPIGDLSEYGSKYKGKSVSRKDLDEFEEQSENEEKENDDENGQESDEVEDDDEEGDDDEEESDEEDDGQENEHDEYEEKQKQVKSKTSKSSNEKGISIMNFNQEAEIEKGKAVKNQLSKYYFERIVFNILHFFFNFMFYFFKVFGIFCWTLA